MNELSEIKRSIRRMALSDNGGMLLLAKVVSVDGDTCSVDVDGLTLTDVRLRAVVNGANSKLLITPKTDSYVLLADLSGNMSSLVVVGFSEIEKIDIEAEGDIVINGGENDGLVKIKELTDKLNGLKDTVNSLVRAYNGHTHTVATTGTAAAQSGTAAAVATQAAEADTFNKSDYENTKIQH